MHIFLYGTLWYLLTNYLYLQVLSTALAIISLVDFSRKIQLWIDGEHMEMYTLTEPLIMTTSIVSKPYQRVSKRLNFSMKQTLSTCSYIETVYQLCKWSFISFCFLYSWLWTSLHRRVTISGSSWWRFGFYCWRNVSRNHTYNFNKHMIR